MTSKKNNAGKPEAVRKDSDGDITHIKFKNRERMTPLDQAINMTKERKTKGIRVNKTKQGREYLQDIPDKSKKDNLDNLPER